jgi:phage FluMu gp28-like protein
MAAILPTLKLDSDATLAKHFALHQIAWIEAEDPVHAEGRQVCALAEKSIRIGWTFADGFKNVRKRLRYKKRD